MKNILLALCFLTFSVGANSQYIWEYGIQFGGSNYLGDIGGQEATRRTSIMDMHVNETQFTIGAYTRYKVNKKVSIHSSLNFIPIEDRDSNSSNPARRARNLNFRNRIIEMTARGELTIFYDNDVGNRGYYNPTFRLYAFAGLAGFYHNPQGQIFEEDKLITIEDGAVVSGDEGEWHDLREWKTEGQKDEYGKFGFAVPFGIGFHFTGNKIWRFGMDVSYRYAFTDYLDDISTTYAGPDHFESFLQGDDLLMAQAFASQSYQGLIDEIDDPLAGSIDDHQWNNKGNGDSVKRGDPTHNDNYLTLTLSAGYVIKGKSKFYKKKYSWLKQRAAARRSRAKF